MERGFHLTVEAFLSLLFFGALVYAVLSPQGESPGLSELYVLQKEHDLLRAWMREKNFSLQEMASDTEFAFPQQGWELEVNGEKISRGNRPKKAISAHVLYITGCGAERVKLTVFME